MKLGELADVIARQLPVNFERSWQCGEVHEDLKKANVTFIFKRVKTRIGITIIWSPSPQFL